ncbi:MAG: arsenate reductase ArsC [Candidatus Neomarinimicrobiota bacterium]|nr:arsenate reductase ArsC [Candidatus Neomarinimicrobiota bacterium]
MGNRTKVIFICTGNSCRSQMAEGLLRYMAGDRFEVFSAGSHPSRLHPASIIVMAELGIDISNHSADSIDEYLDKDVDIVISVCDNARQVCPVFPGDVKQIHWSIDDPFHGWGAKPSDLIPYRETRDILKDQIESFINQKLTGF